MKKDTHNGSPFAGEPTSNKTSKITPEIGNEASYVSDGEPANGEQAQGKRAQHESAASEPASGELAQEIESNIEAESEHLDELAKALAEANELRDKHLRLKAEWDNYRKRTEAERADERSRATQRLVEKILPVLDDMERALEHSENNSAQDSLAEGIAQVYSKLQCVLQSEGVSTIDPRGEPFDANLHCAVSRLEDKRVPDETVLEVLQKGYSMGSRIVRPATVVVSHK
ncbi:MAG: nucleotide exchange factor GrpE [Coriobacteriia bacterium]|nr:nucleotide exchange factor GrpE [Coriobacteriia bacterium]